MGIISPSRMRDAFISVGEPLYAPLGGSLPAWMSLTRASDGWYRQLDDAEGERWAAAGGNDIARFSRPLGGSAVGLLIEKAATNPILQNRNFDDAVAIWSNGSVPVVASAVGPDGLSNNLSVEDTEAGAAATKYQSTTYFADGNVLTWSVFARRLTSPRAELAPMDGANWPSTDAALRTEILGTLWSRYTVTATQAAEPIYLLLVAATGSGWYSGPLAASLGASAFWVPQIDLGHATSPIPTVAAAVTRAADVLQITPSKVAHLLNANRGRLRYRWRPEFADTGMDAQPVLLAIGTAGTTYLDLAASTKKFRIVNDGAAIATFAAGTTWSAHDAFDIDVAWANAVARLSVWKNGVLLDTVQGVWVPPAVDGIWLGSYATTNQASGIFSDVVLG